MASSELPPSYWTYAVHTAAYLQRRLPSSTLPKGVTPYEAMYQKRPGYDHLRVWGSQAFIIDPAEVRPKGGPMRYEGIFVRYEKN